MKILVAYKMERNRIEILESADWIEKALFWFDAICLALFLIAEAIKLVKGLWREVIQA